MQWEEGGGCVIARKVVYYLIGNSYFGFQFLGGAEFGILLPISEFQKFSAEKKSENLKPFLVKNWNSISDFRIPVIVYIGT
jgi:hypothetical protein